MGSKSEKPQKKPRRRRSAEKEAARAAQVAQFRRVMTVAATTAVFGALGIGVLIGVPHLQQGLAAKASIEPVRVAFDWPAAGGGTGTWLPPEARDELMAAACAEIERNPDPFSPTALRRVGEAALASGWFEQIRGVRREPGGIIRVEGAWRIPVGVVRSEGADYLVALGGEILPLSFPQGTSGFRAITGAQLNPPKAGGHIVPGAVWPGADVKAGIELLALITTKPWQSQVAAVDVSEYPATKQLALITTRRGRVVWGGGPSDVIPGQVSTQAKLLRLDALYQQHRMIDAGHRSVWVSGPVTTVDDSATANAS